MSEELILIHRLASSDPQGELSFSNVENFAVWKTCLRRILFCNESDFHLCSHLLQKQDQILKGEEALSFLLEVLCGLHSPVVGETEVFGQFKLFIEARKGLQEPLFADHQKWLQFILAEVKKVRSEHLVGIGSQSYGSLLRRHTKTVETVSICGSGHLAQEILPWLAHKRSLHLVCREPAKLQAWAEKYNNLQVSPYTAPQLFGEALIVAAPLSDSRIVDLLHQAPEVRFVYDLRGEENSLPSLISTHFPKVQLMGLQKFFAEIEETKKDTHAKIQLVKNHLFEKALAFMQRTELRPLGWDDLCA